SGTITAAVNGRRYQYAFYPLSSLDWYYVAAVEVAPLLASKEKPATTDPRKAVAAQPKAPPPQPATASVSPPRPAPLADVGAGTEARDDAGAPDGGALRSGKLVPWPSASAAPSGEAPMPPNPFEKWKAYERRKKP